MSLCPEAELRAAMDDGEFWAHVFDPFTSCVDYDPGYNDPPLGPLTEPCPDCGALGACAWDAEGRPLIHPVSVEEEA